MALDKQVTFDKVATHLLTQNAQSRDTINGPCLYRDAKGRRCALGCLIPDELYDPKWEGHGLLGGSFSDIWTAVGASSVDGPFLEDLQWVHDFYPISSWPLLLKAIASKYALSTKVVDEFPA